MQYDQFLKESPPGCPFCRHEAFDPTVLITQNRKMLLTVAKAPYVRDQLLIIPKRHIERFSDLTFLELLYYWKMIVWAEKRLTSLGYTGYSQLLREGDGVGKSIPHLHFHLIPGHEVHIQNSTVKRRVLSVKELRATVERFFK
jgi:diadenosine tetraphosphate (Ap4A) HIT family hydrolase